MRERARGLARPLAYAGLVCLGAGAWLLFPRAPDADARPAVRAVLVDASASAARRSTAWHLWARRALQEQALAAREAGEELAVVLYAADIERLFGPGPPDAWIARLEGGGGEPVHLRRDPPADLASDLAGALELVQRELVAESRPPGRLAILGDGGATGRDPEPMLARFVRDGVRVERIDAPAPDLPDLALVELRLPEAPAEGEPLAASAVLELRPGAQTVAELLGDARVVLHVELDSPAGRRAFELEPEGFPATGDPPRLSLPIELGPALAGRTLVRARASLIGPGVLRAGDPCPENDALSALARAAGARVAAAVAAEEDLSALRAWLGGGERYPGIQWIHATPRELPALAGELDLLVSFDLSHAALPEAIVRELVLGGGGWLFCGGWALLRDWERGGDERGLAELLPVDLGRPSAEERDVLLLVDGSGSMAGEPFERVKEALVDLVSAALPGDHLYLRFFTGALTPGQELTAPSGPERRRALARLLRTRVPRGPTAILDSLEQLARERAASPRPALVLLLSDGRDRTAFDVERRAAELRTAFAESSTRLTVIAAGTGADLELLGALVPPGEELQVAEDLRDLSELFQREIHRERVREGPDLRARPAAPEELAALPPARVALEAQLARPPADWPPLERYARAVLVPGAAAPWLGVEGEPLLAVQRAGEGLVAAWLSAPLPGWAPEWGGAEDLLGPLFRALARPLGEPSGLRVELRGERLELRGAGPDWPAVVEARVFAPALASAFEGSGLEAVLGTLELAPPTRIAGADLRSSRVAPRPGFLEQAPPGAPLRVELADPRGGRVLAQLGLVAPRPAELEPARPVPPPPRVAEPAPRPASRPSAPSGGPAVLLAGLALLAAAALAGLEPGRAAHRPRTGAD